MDPHTSAKDEYIHSHTDILPYTQESALLVLVKFLQENYVYNLDSWKITKET